MAIGWTAVGIIGTVIVLAVGHPEKIVGRAMCTIVGLFLILISAVTRRGRDDRKISGNPEDLK